MTDVAIPVDWMVKDKDEKILKFQALRVVMLKLWNTKAIVIPFIVESLAVTSINIEKHLMEIPIELNSTALIKSTRLESSTSCAVY